MILKNILIVSAMCIIRPESMDTFLQYTLKNDENFQRFEIFNFVELSFLVRLVCIHKRWYWFVLYLAYVIQVCQWLIASVPKTPLKRLYSVFVAIINVCGRPQNKLSEAIWRLRNTWKHLLSGKVEISYYSAWNSILFYAILPDIENQAIYW